MRIPRLPRALAATAAAALLVAACSGSSATQAPASQAASAPAASSGGGSGVSIANFKFDPANSTVAVGGSLTWTNKDDAAHTVTFDDASITSSGNLAKDQTFSATFPAAGTFTYKCSIHTSMTGQTTVS